MKEFQALFIVGRRTSFEVRYYTLGNNKKPYFATSANVLDAQRPDYERCGQCQADVLDGEALTFYQKWDKHHLKQLDKVQHTELLRDLEALKVRYPFHKITDGRDITFGDELQLSRAYRVKTAEGK